MGVESFVIKLMGAVDANLIEAALISDFRFRPDERYENSLRQSASYLLYDDNRHIIEVELTADLDDCELSLRFALCHPMSVDDVFIGMALALMSRFSMAASIRNSIPDGAPEEYLTTNAAAFDTTCRWSIGHARERWKAIFGSEEATLSIRGAFQKFFFAGQGDP